MHAVHALLDRGVGLLDCSRRLGLSLDTVKRYARVSEPQRLRRPPQYRVCLVDDYRDHLRTRRTTEPGVSVKKLLEEITAMGYTGSLNLLYKYINQGRLDGDRRVHLDQLVAACPEMTALADIVRGFAQLMADRRGADLDNWITQVRNAELVELEPFLAGLEQDHDAAIAGLTEPYSNGPIEGINTKPN